MIKMILLSSALIFSSGAMTGCVHNGPKSCCGDKATECPMGKDGKHDGHDCGKGDHEGHKHGEMHDHKDCKEGECKGKP